MAFVRIIRAPEVALCSVLLVLAACGDRRPIDGEAAMAHVRHFVEKIGPRPFGSDELARTADYISDELRKIGLEPRRHEVVDPVEHKTIRNLYTKIDGADPEKGPILLLGAHYDTKLTHGHDSPAHNFRFVGAIDGGGAPALLIELARTIKNRAAKPKVNIWLYWIDAEESIDFDWKPERALIGSKAFCKWLAAEKLLPRVKTFVLLDLLGDKDFKIDQDGKSNKELQDIFRKAADEIGLGESVYKYKSSTTDDHETFIGYGVRSVLLIDFFHRVPPHLQQLRPGEKPADPQGYSQWWHTPDDTLDKMSAASLAKAGHLVLHALPALEDFTLRQR